MMGGLTRIPIAAQDPGFLGTLGEAALPVEDLPISNGHFFRFEQSGVLVGFGGFEPYGGDALLRSVVVTPSMRGRGTGRAIAEALAVEMRAAGIERAFLLTTTAEDFFRHLGFIEIDRSAAPATILATPQATTICRSAAMLSKAI